MDRTKIEALETSAGRAGDLLMAAICQIALHGEPNARTLDALTPADRVTLHRDYEDGNAGGWRRLAAEQECVSVIDVQVQDE